MTQHVKSKLGSMIIIVLLTTTGAGALFLSNLDFISDVNAASSWDQSTYDDFKNGSLENVMLERCGNDTVIRLDIAKFELDTWVENAPKNKPLPRIGHAMATIWGTDKVLLFGGGNYTGIPQLDLYNDTWIYDFSEDTWTNMSPAGNISPSVYHTMAPIYGTDNVLLFGHIKGWRTWIYDLSENNWTEKSAKIDVYGAINGPSVAPIFGTDKVVLFGSLIPCNLTWIYDLSADTWTNVTPKFPAISPKPRYSTGMASIYGTDKVVIFGGREYGNFHPVLDDTWVYDYSDNEWTNMSTMNKPPARDFHAMASIYGYDKVIMYGGLMGAPSLNDTVIYDLSDNTWTKMNPQKYPLGRCAHAMASIWGTANGVMFGGSYPNNKQDTWTYSCFEFRDNGSYISIPYEMGPNTTLKTINWNASTTDEARIKFQLRTSVSESGLISEDFVGYDGNPNTNYNVSNSSIWAGHAGDRWVQYKAIFNTTNLEVTPILRNVSIIYNHWPNTTLLNPSNNSILINNTPTFEWNFTDSDSENQSAFQIVFDNNADFSSIDFNTGELNSTNCSWQWPNGTNSIELLDGTWYWKTRTKDYDGDWGLYSESWKIIIDSKPPNSTVTKPFNYSKCNCVNTISGLAVDPINGTGINKIEISIERLYDNSFWDGESWVKKQTWLETTGYTNWIYDSTTIPWTSGMYYYIQSRAIDNATNIETPASGNVFLFDPEIPSISISHPNHNSWLNRLDSIYGSALDEGGSLIEKVELSIKNLNNAKYWNGLAWVTGKTWLLAAGTITWSFNSSVIPWTTDTRYQLEGRVSDYANNIGTSSDQVIFGIDLDFPSSIIQYPVNNSFVNILESISGSASDKGGAGIKTVEISIKANSNNYFWNSTNWVVDETWVQSSGEGRWSFSSTEQPWKTDNQYTIRSRAIDFAGNLEIPGNGTTFLFDDRPPDISIIINNGDEYTNSTIVIFSLDAQDYGAGADLMRFSYDGTSWSKWEPFVNERLFTLSPSNGEKVIYFQVQDRAGNIAESAFDTIFLDTNPPEVSMLINNGARYTNSEQVILTLNATDMESGIASMAFRTGLTWTPWESYKEVRSLSLPLGFGDGEITVYHRVRDFANNIAIISKSIILDRTPPHSISISIFNDSYDRVTNSVKLKLIAFDNTSGIDLMSFSQNGENWSPWEDFLEVKSYVLASGEAAKKIYFKVKDRAGNIAGPVNTTIPSQESSEKAGSTSTLNLWNILFIIIILIIIFIMIVFIFRRKKKKEKAEPELALTIKPRITSIPEKVEGEKILEQKPEQIPTTPTPSETPKLVEPTTSTPGTTPVQISQPQQVPQLPPAQEQNLLDESAT